MIVFDYVYTVYHRYAPYTARISRSTLGRRALGVPQHVGAQGQSRLFALFGGPTCKSRP